MESPKPYALKLNIPKALGKKTYIKGLRVHINRVFIIKASSNLLSQ
jgi:hypothetical protein